MEDIIVLIRELLNESEVQDLITFLTVSYPDQANKSRIYLNWPNLLQNEASDQLKELLKKYSRKHEKNT
jgi:hypothetical protein